MVDVSLVKTLMPCHLHSGANCRLENALQEMERHGGAW